MDQRLQRRSLLGASSAVPRCLCFGNYKARVFIMESCVVKRKLEAMSLAPQRSSRAVGEFASDDRSALLPGAENFDRRFFLGVLRFSSRSCLQNYGTIGQ